MVGELIMEVSKENKNPNGIECVGENILNTIVSRNPESSKVKNNLTLCAKL